MYVLFQSFDIRTAYPFFEMCMIENALVFGSYFISGESTMLRENINQQQSCSM